MLRRAHIYIGLCSQLQALCNAQQTSLPLYCLTMDKKVGEFE
jgi:hypothetical protein